MKLRTFIPLGASMLAVFPLVAAAVPGSVVQVTLAVHKVCQLDDCTVAGDR